MLSRIRPRLTYANVMSSIAVFVVLGGGAYATIDRKIQTADIAKRAVGTGKLKPGAVGPGKLKNQAVRTQKIAGLAVGPGKLANDAVTSLKIRDGAVNRLKLADEAVGFPQIGEGAVIESKIGNGAVSTAKIGDGAVNTAKLANGAVSGPKLATINVVTQTQAIAGNGTLAVFGPNCPAGTQVISGGYTVTSFAVHSVVDRINLPTNGWRAAFQNTGAGAASATVQANCLAG